MFAIVEFTTERACEVVPKTWIRHNKCAWPSSNDPAKIRNLVNKSKPPKKSWKHHDYKVLSEYETYELALENIDTFMRDSDLSDFETAKKKKKTSDGEHALVSDPIVPAADGSTYEPDDNDVFLEPMTPHLHLVNPNGADSIEQSNTSPNTPVVLNCIDPTPVVTGIAEIKLTLKQILDILQNLSERIEKLENSEGGKTTALVEDALDGTVFNLPITSQELLKDLEDDLGANQMRKQQLIQYFYYKGGSSILEALKLMIGALMIDDLACQYSLAGARGKKAFADFNHLFQAIQGALIKNPLTKGSATEANIRSGLQTYFKLVADRVNARLKKAPSALRAPQNPQVPLNRWSHI